MQNLRRTKKRKIVSISKDIEELAQDKLHELSIFAAEDKFEDQSLMLSLQQRSLTDPLQNNLKGVEDIRRIIARRKNQSAGRIIHHQQQKKQADHQQSMNRRSPHSLLILNKLSSTEVFVGLTANKQKFKQNEEAPDGPCLLIEKKRRANTSPSQSFYGLLSTAKGCKTKNVGHSDLLVVGDQRSNYQKISKTRISWKGRAKSKQNLQGLKQKMIDTLFSSSKSKTQPVEHYV